jgi:hypothetical protein
MPIQAGGDQKYWFKGQTFDGVQKSSSPPDPGSQKYWFKGQTADFLLPTSGGGGSMTAFFMFTLMP